jgi:hypothetical protein
VLGQSACGLRDVEPAGNIDADCMCNGVRMLYGMILFNGEV